VLWVYCVFGTHPPLSPGGKALRGLACVCVREREERERYSIRHFDLPCFQRRGGERDYIVSEPKRFLNNLSPEGVGQS